MNKPVLNIVANFISNDPNNVIITDNTNYVALGLDSTKVKINTRIYIASGTLYVPAYYNTPAVTNDFSPAVPFNYATKLGGSAIPDFLLDSKGCFIDGVYKFDIKWYYIDTEETFDYSFTQTINFDKPKVNIQQLAGCFCATFQSTDKTNYNGTTEISYLHTINYPAETNEADIETELKDYTDQRLANGTYVSEVSTERVIAISSNFTVQCLIYGRESIIVDCDSICDIKCGINNLNAAYEAECGKNSKEATRLKTMLDNVLRYYSIIYINNACGSKIDTDSYIVKIKAILGDCDCGCTDCGDDIWVSGVCGSSGGSAYDPTPIYTYIDGINTALTNLINSYIGDLTSLTTIVNGLLNASWFTGMTIPACLNFLGGDTEIQKKDKILAKICQINAAVFAPPVAKNDISTTLIDIPVSLLVTLNDFATSNVVVTITTAPVNGTAVVLGDNKTITYTPGSLFVGNDTVGYTITDANGQTSTAVWTIIVNAVPSVSCSTVLAKYSASAYPMGIYIEFNIQNLSNIGTNVTTALSYILEIRDAANSILYSYPITGSLLLDTTVFTTPDAFAPNWNNYRILQSITTNSATGTLCGTVTYETPTPYLLTDIGLSWFTGTTPPACLNFLPTDNEIEKRQKLQDAICAAGSSTVNNGVSGLGTVVSPIQLGGPLIKATTIGGIFDIQNINRRQLYGNLSTPLYNVAFSNQEYFVIAHESATNNANGSDIVRKTLKLNFALGSISAGYAISGSSSSVEMVITDNKTISNTSAVSGDYKVLFLSPDTGVTVDAAPNFPSTVNQALAIICKDNNTGTINRPANLSFRPIETKANSASIVSPYHIHLAALDSGDLFSKITGTKWAIFQKGVNDKNEFYGEIIYHGALTNASDERSKDEIREFEIGLEAVESIRPIVFKRKEGFGDTNKQQVGVIAQELELLVPEAVSKYDSNGIEDFRMMNPETLIYVALNAIKELSAQNKSLTERILALENQS